MSIVWVNILQKNPMKIKNVACALLIKDNKILLQNRSNISKYWEEWSFFGGGIEQWETPKIALFRELKEELNLDIPEENITYLWEIVHFMKDFDIEYHRFLFGIHIPEHIITFTDLEWSGAEFFDLHMVKTLKFNTPVEAEISQLENNFLLS